ncbi:MAG: hypothetical protein KDD70_05370 [Bdellovibrionales bacterium]|nr:hypothetical protein [Bdellovibrionales bacterium]
MRNYEAAEQGETGAAIGGSASVKRAQAPAPEVSLSHPLFEKSRSRYSSTQEKKSALQSINEQLAREPSRWSELKEDRQVRNTLYELLSPAIERTEGLISRRKGEPKGSALGLVFEAFESLLDSFDPESQVAAGKEPRIDLYVESLLYRRTFDSLRREGKIPRDMIRFANDLALAQQRASVRIGGWVRSGHQIVLEEYNHEMIRRKEEAEARSLDTQWKFRRLSVDEFQRKIVTLKSYSDVPLESYSDENQEIEVLEIAPRIDKSRVTLESRSRDAKLDAGFILHKVPPDTRAIIRAFHRDGATLKQIGEEQSPPISESGACFALQRAMDLTHRTVSVISLLRDPALSSAVAHSNPELAPLIAFYKEPGKKFEEVFGVENCPRWLHRKLNALKNSLSRRALADRGIQAEIVGSEGLLASAAQIVKMPEIASQIMSSGSFFEKGPAREPFNTSARSAVKLLSDYVEILSKIKNGDIDLKSDRFATTGFERSLLKVALGVGEVRDFDRLVERAPHYRTPDLPALLRRIREEFTVAPKLAKARLAQLHKEDGELSPNVLALPELLRTVLLERELDGLQPKKMEMVRSGEVSAQQVNSILKRAHRVANMLSQLRFPITSDTFERWTGLLPGKIGDCFRSYLANGQKDNNVALDTVLSSTLSFFRVFQKLETVPVAELPSLLASLTKEQRLMMVKAHSQLVESTAIAPQSAQPGETGKLYHRTVIHLAHDLGMPLPKREARITRYCEQLPKNLQGMALGYAAIGCDVNNFKELVEGGSAPQHEQEALSEIVRRFAFFEGLERNGEPSQELWRHIAKMAPEAKRILEVVHRENFGLDTAGLFIGTGLNREDAFALYEASINEAMWRSHRRGNELPEDLHAWKKYERMMTDSVRAAYHLVYEQKLNYEQAGQKIGDGVTKNRVSILIRQGEEILADCDLMLGSDKEKIWKEIVPALPERFAQALHHRFWEKLPIERVGAILEPPTSAARAGALVKEGLAIVRHALEGEAIPRPEWIGKMGTLSESEQLVLRLIDLEGYSVSEAATVICSSGASSMKAHQVRHLRDKALKALEE